MRDLPAELWVDDHISLEAACAVVDRHAVLRVSDDALHRCAAAESRLQDCIALGRHVYGVTTGFGPLANRLVPAEHGVELQQNLVHHLASGVGPDLGWRATRAMVLARLMSILQGVSGASSQAIKALVRVLDSDLAPVIPARGTVGASGDLTPLAHLVLALQGRGDFQNKTGERIDGREALRLLGLAPLELTQRDGLALVNGTSAMTGIAVLNDQTAQRSIEWAVALTGMLAEALRARTEAWHPALSKARPHAPQALVAQRLRQSVEGSALVRSEFIAHRRLDATHELRVEDEAGQDAYTLRCAPQVIGAVLEGVRWHGDVVLRELNAATDNPIFPDQHDVPAVHGGNFMGGQVALCSDTLSTACIMLAGFAERQIARVTDERLNSGLPAFLHRGVAGLNSGFMGAQVTATALVAEMRARGGPASQQSISTNGANQDIVSMGTVAARAAANHLSDLSLIQSILALCVAQAIEFQVEALGCDLTPNSAACLKFVRAISPTLTEDRPLGAEIETLARAMASSPPPTMFSRSETVPDQAV